MTINVDMGDGRIVEFPDVETANQFVSQQQQAAPAQQGIGDILLENIVGRGEVDTPGERLGAAIGQATSGILEGAAGLLDLPAAPARSAIARLGALREGGLEALDAPVPGAGAEALAGPATRAVEGIVQPPSEAIEGQFARTVGQFVPGALLGGVSPSNLARFAVAPGVASEAAGQLTKGTEFEPFARAGAALAAPAAVSGARALAQRAVSPGAGAPQARLSAARTLENEGIRVTAGQATGNESQLFREAATTAGRQIVDDQAGQFTKAVLKRIGANADAATPEVLVSASRRIGGVFDDVAKGVDVTPAPTLLQRSSQILREYNQLSPKAAQAPIVGEIHRKMTRAFRAGDDLTSKQVLNWRSALSKLTRTGDAATRSAAVDMVNTLDDALGQSLTSLGRADDIQRLTQARQQWGNLIAIENSVTRAGEAAATGIITPANLRNALAAQGRRAFAQGRGDLNELARAGVTVIKPLPQSGTQPRTLARELTAGAQGGTAAGLGSFALGADPVTAATIGGAAVIAPRLRNAFLASPAGQAFMRNQLMQSTPQAPNVPGQIGGLASGLLGGN